MAERLHVHLKLDVSGSLSLSHLHQNGLIHSQGDLGVDNSVAILGQQVGPSISAETHMRCKGDMQRQEGNRYRRKNEGRASRLSQNERGSATRKGHG